MTLRILTVTVDSTDLVPLAQWWADQLGGQVNDPFGGFFLTSTPRSIGWSRRVRSSSS
jgi:hypothetical protein